MRRNFRGWTCVGVLVALVVLTALIIDQSIGGLDGLMAAIRFTARTSFVLFLATFTASALYYFFPSPITYWLRANRRYLGLAFFGSILVHLIFIILLWNASPNTFWSAQTEGNLIVGIITYAIIFAMAGTSSNAAVKAMGTRAWCWLHWIGTYYIWASYLVGFAKRAAVSNFYIPFVIALLIAVSLRFAACISMRRLAKPAMNG